jgi:hypothetical protein
MNFELSQVWATFNTGLVLSGLVLIVAGVALAWPRPMRALAANSAAVSARTGSLRRTLGIGIVGLGILLLLWGLALVRF